MQVNTKQATELGVPNRKELIKVCYRLTHSRDFIDNEEMRSAVIKELDLSDEAVNAKTIDNRDVLSSEFMKRVCWVKTCMKNCGILIRDDSLGQAWVMTENYKRLKADLTDREVLAFHNVGSSTNK